jgi:hypothetical protein
LDFSCPKKTHIGSLSTIEFCKYKLLRSLENFVHILTTHLAHRPKYFYRLCRKLRHWLRTFAFKAAFNGLKPFCKGKYDRTKTHSVEKPTVVRTRTKVLKEPAIKSQIPVSDEDTDSSDYLPRRYTSSESSSQSSSEDWYLLPLLVLTHC